MFDKDFYDKMIDTHQDVKYILDWNASHKKEDDTRYLEIKTKTEFLTKCVYVGIGGFAVLELLLNVLK